SAQQYIGWRSGRADRSREPQHGVVLLFQRGAIRWLDDLQYAHGWLLTSWNDECVGALEVHFPEIGGAATPRAGDHLVCAAFVDTQPAVDPVERHAVLACEFVQRAHPGMRRRMRFFFERAA